MSADTAYRSLIGRTLFEAEVSDHEALVIFLLWAKSTAKAEWMPLIDALPREMDLPMFWNKKELKRIKCKVLRSTIDRHEEYLQEAYPRLFGAQSRLWQVGDGT